MLPCMQARPGFLTTGSALIFQEVAGCNPDLLGSRAFSKFGGRTAANGPWSRTCGRWRTRSEVEVISNPRPPCEVGEQGTRDNKDKCGW